MSQWWRAYNSSIDNPKLLKLSDAMHRAWYTLQCVASENDGTLPATEDIAARLRMKPAKVAEWITKLVQAKLIDNNNGVFAPHNWDTRQYKSDAADPTAAQRMKRYRENKRNDRNLPVTQIRPETEQIQSDDERKTRAGTSLISAEAFEIADALEKACGYDLPEEIPPGWCGGAMWVQKCLSEGWLGPVMVEAAKGVAKRAKSPIMGFKYLERPLAQAMAEHSAPLPSVEVRQPEKLTVVANGRQQQPGSIIQAADRLLDKIRSFDAGPGDDNGVCDGEGQAPARLLSKG